MTEATDNRLRLLIERVETINAEIKATQEDRKEVFAEMKAVGYDVKAVKEVIRLRAMRPPRNADGTGYILRSDGAGMSFGCCHYCQRQLTAPGTGRTSYTRDHMRPQSRGGYRTVRCCLQCNNLKGNMSFEAWRGFMTANPQWWRNFHHRGDVLAYLQARRWSKPITEGSSMRSHDTEAHRAAMGLA